MNYVIIGACAAGLSTAEAIRKADAKGNITMLTEEAYLPYSRPSKVKLKKVIWHCASLHFIKLII